MKIIGERIRLRDFVIEDYKILEEWSKMEEWKKWDAPWEPCHLIPFERFQDRVQNPSEPRQRMIIEELDGKPLGTVAFYWVSKLTNWLEVGIDIHDPSDWGKGYAVEALKLWIDYLLSELPIVRIGLSTWSGNQRMMRVGEKLGMQLEARVRKTRIVNGEYYDSITMGVLREEWKERWK